MAKKQRTFWGVLLKIVLTLAIVVVVVVVGVYAYAEIAFGVNVFDVYGQFKKLNETVSEKKLITNPYKKEDFNNLISKLDVLGIGEDYLYRTEDGEIIIDPQNYAGQIMTGDLKLTDKEFASLISNSANYEIEKSIDMGEIGGEELKLKIMQVKFSELIVQNGQKQITLNVVLRVDLSQLKTQMNVFPLTLINGLIPKYLYISSNTVIQKTTDPVNFGYNVISAAIKVNNLTSSETTNLFATLNKFVNVGNIQQLNRDIGQMFANSLIGNDNESDGLTYKLKEAGAIAFDFELQAPDSKKIYFIIKTA